jgi:hypothetical protein
MDRVWNPIRVKEDDMQARGIRARIKEKKELANPEGGRMNLSPGQWIWVAYIYYPDEPIEGRDPVKDWSFWTNGDIDGAYIFKAEDVSEIEVPADFNLPQDFDKAPFTVTRKGENKKPADNQDRQPARERATRSRK